MTYRTPVIAAPDGPGAPPTPAPHATLAALARRAPPLAAAAASAPWAATPEESPEEYDAFLAWLDVPGAARGVPPAPHAASAARHHWAERALAFDRTATLAPVATPAGGGTPEQRIVANLTRLVEVESKKALDAALQAGGPTIPLKDLTATVRVLQELHDAGRGAGAAASAATDLSKLTKEELQQWLAIQRKLKARGT